LVVAGTVGGGTGGGGSSSGLDAVDELYLPMTTVWHVRSASLHHDDVTAADELCLREGGVSNDVSHKDLVS